MSCCPCPCRLVLDLALTRLFLFRFDRILAILRVLHLGLDVELHGHTLRRTFRRRCHGPGWAAPRCQTSTVMSVWDARCTDTLIMSRCRCWMVFQRLAVDDPVEVLSNGLRLKGFEQCSMTIEKQALCSGRWASEPKKHSIHFLDAHGLAVSYFFGQGFNSCESFPRQTITEHHQVSFESCRTYCRQGGSCWWTCVLKQAPLQTTMSSHQMPSNNDQAQGNTRNILGKSKEMQSVTTQVT